MLKTILRLRTFYHRPFPHSKLIMLLLTATLIIGFQLATHADVNELLLHLKDFKDPGSFN